MPEVTIFTGNIGTGKSLIAAKYMNLYKDAMIVNMDNIQASLSGGDYGKYDPGKKEVYLATEEAAIKSGLKNNKHVVVDRTNMDRKSRKRFIDLGKEFDAKINSIDFGPGDEKSLERRLKNCRGIPAITWEKVHAYMQESYEEPAIEEGFGHIIKLPKRFAFHAFDFDGTIADNKFPEIGELLDGTVHKINDLYKDLSNIIIIWTCRSGDYENEMRQFLIKQGIPFDFINENPIFDPGGRKIFAHKYYDDRGTII